MPHGRRRGYVALLVLCGFLSVPSRIAAQQFPPFPDPAIDNSFNGGAPKNWWGKPYRREAAPRDIRPEIRNVANVTAEPAAAPRPRLRKSQAAATSKRSRTVQSIRPNSAAWWKQIKADPAVLDFRNCVTTYTAGETDRDKDATLAALLVRATEGACRKQADLLMHMLAERAGESGIEPIMRELVQSIFVPAARSALAAHQTPAEASTGSIKTSPPSEASLNR
jgi:hypothetical protein